MSKKIKIIISVLALISVVFSSFIIFRWKIFFNEQKEDSNLSDYVSEGTIAEEELLPIPVINISSDIEFSLPVEAEYFEGNSFNGEDSQMLSFYLDSGVSIKAIFDGEVKKVLYDQKVSPEENILFTEIWLEETDGNFLANYYIIGNILVKEGEKVKEGELLARAGRKEGVVANLALSVYNKDSIFLRLSKGIFK